MFLPSDLPGKRVMADFPKADNALLVRGTNCATVNPVGRVFSKGASSTHLNHTPSPQGQYSTAPCVLPRLFATCAGKGMGTWPASAPEPLARFRVGSAGKSRQGTRTCPSEQSSSPRSPAPGLRPAAIRWANRHLAVPPLARGPRPSPAAALHRARPSARPATSPTASFTPASVTDPFSGARGFSARRPAMSTPARFAPSRGFRVSLKTQKDFPCSRKS